MRPDKGMRPHTEPKKRNRKARRLAERTERWAKQLEFNNDPWTDSESDTDRRVAAAAEQEAYSVSDSDDSDDEVATPASSTSHKSKGFTIHVAQSGGRKIEVQTPKGKPEAPSLTSVALKVRILWLGLFGRPFVR